MDSHMIDLQLLIKAKHHSLVKQVIDVSYLNGDIGGTERIRIDFHNERSLSVITGKYAHTSDGKPYELAVLNKYGEIDYGMNFIEDPSRDTVGYCTLEKVSRYIKHAGEYNG